MAAHSWSRPMKKTVYTLNIDNYEPQITELTYPFLRHWAKKIGAEFYVIKTRRWPNFPPVYEKFQIYDLSREHHNDWSLYVDSDALLHPDLFDITVHLEKDTCFHYSKDMASLRWRYDHYFLRDGRNIGSGNWFTGASDWCRDLWHPLEDLTLEEAIANINPIVNEENHKIEPAHLIDDYVCSRNIARYGLKFITYLELQRAVGDGGQYHWHQYTRTKDEKIGFIRQTIRDWKVLHYLDGPLQRKVLETTIERPPDQQNGQVVQVPVPFHPGQIPVRIRPAS